MSEGNLSLGILLLGIAGMAAFIAMRPWPASPEGRPISTGAYVVEILQGAPPPASLNDPSIKENRISEIENGLMAVVLIWMVSRIITGIFSILGWFGFDV